MNSNVLNQVRRIAIKLGYSGQVTEENAQEIIQSLAENKPDFLAEEIDRLYRKAVNSYTGASGGDKYWHEVSDLADSIMLLLDIKTDYPGLYPTFELDRGGKHFTENGALNAIRQHNNFWNHWKDM